MEDSARSTKDKRTNATRSTTETLLYAVGMEECGNVSVTPMLLHILCVRAVSRKANLYQHKKCIISFLFRKAEHMQETTSLLCVWLVILKSMPSVEIDGTNKVVASTIVVATSFMGRGIKISTPFHSCNGRGVLRTNSQKFSGE